MSTTEIGRPGRHDDDLDEPRRSADPMARASIFFGLAASAAIFVPAMRPFGIASCVLAFGLALRSRGRARRQGSEVRVASLVLAVFAAIGLIASVTAFGSVDSPSAKPAVTPSAGPDGKPVSGVVGKDIEVVFGSPRVELDEFGLQRLSLPVTITNKTDDAASFDLDFEARKASGSLVTTDTAYVPDLAPGQSAQIRIFNFVNEKLLAELSGATYSVGTAVKY